MKAPAFQFYVRDWISSRKVQKMTGDEVKAYVYLLAESWLEDPRATLPDDDEELATMAQLSQEKWLKVKAKVMANFVMVDGRWVNEKLLGISASQSKFKKWGSMGGNPNLIKNKESEPKQVNPMVNGEVNPTLNPIVNLATASASSTASNTASNTASKKLKLSDDEFISSLKSNPAYSHVSVDDQLSKMDAWLLTHPGRQKTRKFIVGWLNRIDKPIAPSVQSDTNNKYSFEFLNKKKEARRPTYDEYMEKVNKNETKNPN